MNTWQEVVEGKLPMINWPPQRLWFLGCVEPGRRQVPDFCPLDLVQIMGETLKDPVIKRCCEAPNRLSDLQHISEGLEKCQKSLNDYLDSKRNAFPRFFFISDDELLSILGSSDPLCVQEHMIKVGQASGAGAGRGGGRLHGLCPAVCFPRVLFTL